MHESNVTHHGLRASTVFVYQDQCVLTDFGASRQSLEELSMANGTANKDDSFRWLAPECLRIRDTEDKETDVWAFGVVLFELWTDCQVVPYDPWDFGKILIELTIGSRLPRPDKCPALVYEAMMACWHPLPARRPQFTHIETRLATLAAMNASDINPSLAATYGQMYRRNKNANPPMWTTGGLQKTPFRQKTVIKNIVRNLKDGTQQQAAAPGARTEVNKLVIPFNLPAANEDDTRQLREVTSPTVRNRITSFSEMAAENLINTPLPASSKVKTSSKISLFEGLAQATEDDTTTATATMRRPAGLRLSAVLTVPESTDSPSTSPLGANSKTSKVPVDADYIVTTDEATAEATADEPSAEQPPATEQPPAAIEQLDEEVDEHDDGIYDNCKDGSNVPVVEAPQAVLQSRTSMATVPEDAVATVEPRPAPRALPQPPPPPRRESQGLLPADAPRPPRRESSGLLPADAPRPPAPPGRPSLLSLNLNNPGVEPRQDVYEVPRALLEPEFVHGQMSREEASELVSKTERGGGVYGAFLVRRKRELDNYAITVFHSADKIMNHLLVRRDDGWYVNTSSSQKPCAELEFSLEQTIKILSDERGKYRLPLHHQISCLNREIDVNEA